MRDLLNNNTRWVLLLSAKIPELRKCHAYPAPLVKRGDVAITVIDQNCTCVGKTVLMAGEDAICVPGAKTITKPLVFARKTVGKARRRGQKDDMPQF